jgi:hypothetical protein
MPLVDHEDSVLVVIDAQERFFGVRPSRPKRIPSVTGPRSRPSPGSAGGDGDREAHLRAHRHTGDGEMHRRGLERMVAEGVELNHCKGLAYEWTRTVESSRAVLWDREVGEPPFRI